MSHDSLVTKPASGRWTDAYPELGRGPVSLEDCVSPELYEKEREHVFKKTWLYVGRVERVPKSGSYFTRELKFLNTSIIIVRGKDDVIRAFHNICPHRGNKMLWEDDPFQEVQGRAPLLLPLQKFFCSAKPKVRPCDVSISRRCGRSWNGLSRVVGGWRMRRRRRVFLPACERCYPLQPTTR